MAIIWADDYKTFGTNTAVMLNGLYAEVSNISIIPNPDPLVAGNVLKIISQTDATGVYLGAVLRRVIPVPAATVGFAQRYWFTSLPNSTSQYMTIMSFCDISNQAHVSLRLGTTGAITVYRGDSGNGGGSVAELGATGPVITANSWNHIEAKVLVSDTVGTVEIRVNTTPVLTLTGVDTRNGTSTTVDQLRMSNAYNGAASVGPSMYCSDYVIWDASGTRNNDFMGSVSVLRLTTESDTSFNWTASSGSTGWNLIDEAGPDDADYVTAAHPPPAASTFALSNLPPDVTSIRGLVSLVRAKKTDGGDGNIQVSIMSGASASAGADRPITTTSTYWWDVSEISPATGVAWTPAEVDAATIKLNRTL
jgi:hypothetical protein